MIEGLRALPYLQEARREHKTLLQCESCMQTTDAEQRQMMGCGYELPADGAVPWSPDPLSITFEHCAGYTARLPDVIDIADAYWWADKGAAGNLQQASVPLRVGLRVLRDAIADADALKHKNATKGRA